MQGRQDAKERARAWEARQVVCRLTFFQTICLLPKISTTSVSKGEPLAVSCLSTVISAGLDVEARRTLFIRWRVGRQSHREG